MKNIKRKCNPWKIFKWPWSNCEIGCVQQSTF